MKGTLVNEVPDFRDPRLGLPMVYLVDDEAVIRDALAWLLRSRRLLSEAYASADAFELLLAKHAPHAPPGANPTGSADRGDIWPRSPSCVVLDVRMPGTSGLVLFERLAERGLLGVLPVIFLTGHADVPTAVDAVKRGAFDFCEKPFSDNALVDRVEQALAQSRSWLQANQKTEVLMGRQGELTERERNVMQLVLEGLPNKLIADRLNISIRTVEVHRARVFEKMEVKSAVELANLLRLRP